MRRQNLCFVIVAASAWLAACGSRTENTEPDGTPSESVPFIGSSENPANPELGAATGSDPGSPVGQAAPNASGNVFTSTDCLAGDIACTNCIDDDGDGLVDAWDPECTGPMDNDEGSFATGIPGDNIDFCQDCFFDGNSGHGDDGCQYHTECLYGNAPPGRGGSGCFSCDVTDQCRNSCLYYTPNGCDCFGCCEITDDEGVRHQILLSEGCSADNLEGCTTCQQSTDCRNDCGPCELCIGKTEVDPSCDNGGDEPVDGGSPEQPAPECPSDQTSCTATAPCSAGYFCLTGCCVSSSGTVR